MRAWLDRLRRRFLKRAVTEYVASVTPEPGRSGLAIVGIVKNEANYLAEWLEFHLMMGAGHIYLYDNGSSDRSGEVTQAFEAAGEVTVIAWPTLPAASPQLSAYADAVNRFGGRWRWMAFIDVDEFLYPAEGDTLTGTLERRYGDLPGLEVPWRNFGFGGHDRTPAMPVIAAYTRRASGPATATRHLKKVKSIVDPAAIAGIRTAHHFPYRRGAPLRLAPGDEPIRLNHYFTRSREEFETKLGAGNVFWGGIADMRRINHERRLLMARLIEESPVDDTAILRFVPELERRMSARRAARDAAQARA